MYAVGCTIKTIRTDLSCDIEIGVKIKEKNGFRPFWKTIGGRLDLREDDGVWFYFSPQPENKRIGIVLFPQGPTDSRNWGWGDIVATLLGVPDRFSERLECGKSWGGEGTLHRTVESLDWRMWFPCA